MDKKAYMKAYYLKNKEKIKERAKANYHDNIEERKNQKAEYYKDNREKIIEKAKEWGEKNKEQRKEYIKKYGEKNKEHLKEYQKTPNIKKTIAICSWKKIGLISEDYDALYQKYIESTNCEECNCEFGKYGDGTGTWRCMDHDHESGLFRNFLCCACNIKRG